MMLWALPLFLTALVVKADPLPIRPPVVGYAGLLSPMRQAVLLDPKHVLDEAVKQREEPALSTTSPIGADVTPSGSVNTPTASALFQASRSVRPILFSRSGNGTRKRIRRIRPRLQGLRRKTGSAALLSSAGVRTAVSQAAGLARRRSGVKVGQYGGPPRWGNSQGILQTRTAQQGVPVPIKEAENKSSVDDFLTRWRKIYSKGHTTTPVSTAGHHQAWNEDEIAKKPKPSATTLLPRHRERTSNSDTNRFNPSQIMEAKHPFAPVAHLSKMPSVHELTSFHFSDSNALSQALDNSDVMQKLQSSTTTTEAPTTTTPTTTSVMLLTSPRTQRPFENVAQEREILESIQSIFQTVDRDGQQAPANEVESPPSFDIFAGSEATQGFRPSFRLRPEVEVQNSYSVYEEQADKQVPSYGTSNLGSWETNDAYTTPDNTLAHNAGPTVLVSTPPPGSDLTLHVGHSLPVMNNSPAMAEQRQTESFNGNIIIGRPAALIQPPTDTPERIVDAPALPHYREEPMYIHNPPTAPTQPSILFSPRPIWEPEELGPLLQYIESTYDPKLSQNSQHSVSHLQSMIKSGQAPNVFVNDQLVDYIRNRPHLQLPPGLSRFGQPPRQSIERASVDALDNGGLRTGSAFVALSGIALAFVLGAYFLFTGSVDQARGSQDPIRARVEDAKKGLRLLMKGLDEYEQYLDTDKTEEDEREEPIESDTSYDIPVILNKIWDNLSSTVNHILEYESHFNNGARTPVSSEDNSSGETYFRKPHVMSIFPDPEDSEISLGSSGNLINTNEGKDSSSLSGSNLNSSIKGSPAGNQSIFDIIAQLRQEYLVQKEKEKKMKTTTELSITTTDDSLTNEPETYTPRHEAEELENDRSKERYTEITYDDTNFTEQTMLSTTWENEVTEENRVTEDEYPTDAEDLLFTLQQESGQENTGLDTTTLTLEGRPTPTTTTTPSSLAKKVIINNHLHVYHNPETDPPRSSAFLNNVPFRRLT
ncbi:uncharacterized protein LOC122249232 [Penaeus japonicus]|uniref:uncharacterized protein LOC122249232 n=1 Tax=Penaeus japonicus TaxID=27405 RepID=UPI001C7117B1|nr:uncharacterized protein LOC122249232 [Penaeus japonicus]